MFDLSFAHMAIIVVVALLVLGPKELPNALRTVSALMKNARKLAGEFQSGVNEIIREADLEDARKQLAEVQSLNKNQIQAAIEKAVDPTGEVKAALKIDEDTSAAPVPLPPATDTPAIEDHAVEEAAARKIEDIPPLPSRYPPPLPPPGPAMGGGAMLADAAEAETPAPVAQPAETEKQ